MTNFPHCSPCPPGGRTSPLVSPEQSPSHAPSAKRRLLLLPLLRSDASVHKFSLSERKLATEGGGEGRGLSRCLMLQNGSNSSDMLLNEKASYVPRKALINSKQLSHLEIIFFRTPSTPEYSRLHWTYIKVSQYHQLASRSIVLQFFCRKYLCSP